MYAVYVVQSLRGPIKIGVAENPERRLSTLQGGNPDEIRLEFYLCCADRESAYQVEAHLHRRYAAYRVNGEWFSIGIDSVISDIQWSLQLSRAVEGIVFYEHVKTDVTHRHVVVSSETSRQRVLQYLRIHPEIVEKLQRGDMRQIELAHELSASKATICRAIKDYKAHSQNGNGGEHD
jgi:hypothetical protein